MKANDSIAYQKATHCGLGGSRREQVCQEAYNFANRIVKAYRYLTEKKREYVLSK